MYNATRRNRNIGTDKAGWKKQTPFREAPFQGFEPYLKAEKIQATVRGVEITFYVDELKQGYVHSCTVQDVVEVLSQLPKEDVDGLEYFYFKQPTRKQNVFHPVWGRLQYFAGPDYSPLITLEAHPCPLLLKMDTSQPPFWQQEVEFLKGCCESYELTKRHHEMVFRKDHLRKVQLYRTIPHEVGHWVDYKLGLEDKPLEYKERRANQYARRFFPSKESEMQNMQECKVLFKPGTTREQADALVKRYSADAKIDTFYEKRLIGCNEVTFGVVTLPIKDSTKIQDDPNVIRVEVITTFRGSKSDCGSGGCGSGG